MEEEHRASGREHRFHALKDLLTGESKTPYGELAEQLETSVSGVKSAIHRMRKRFGEVLREEVAATVADRSEVDEELRHLLEMSAKPRV